MKSTIPLARGPLQISPLQFLDVGFHKTLRHPLHAAVAMPGFPPRLRRIKLQDAMFCGTMPAFAYVANVNAAAVPNSVTHSSSRKSHGIPRPIPRQPAAALCIAEVAELP